MEKQNEKLSSLSLPCLRGSIGDWNYYSVVIPFKELNRIDNEHIIKEDIELDKWLQRNLSKRVDLIRDYLLNEGQRYFNSIIVGVYSDVPDWYALDLSKIQLEFNLNIGKLVQETLGILALSGREKLFTIDGQHRIAAIKLALLENPNRFKNDELSVVFVAHKEDEVGRIRTRKLFATINREAKTPTANDLAIIDEIYAYNIIARDLYAKYNPFKKLIALTENRNIDRRDQIHFTNLLSLVEVNKKILKLVNYKQSKYEGPSPEYRVLLLNTAVEFWDFMRKNIADYNNFFSGKFKMNHYRNSERKKPLNLLFMPIGMKLIAEIYYEYKRKNKINVLISKINKINFWLNDEKAHFSMLYYNNSKNTMILNNQTVAKKLFLYLMSERIDEISLKNDLAKAYGINELSEHFKKFTLPDVL